MPSVVPLFMFMVMMLKSPQSAESQSTMSSTISPVQDGRLTSLLNTRLPRQMNDFITNTSGCNASAPDIINRPECVLAQWLSPLNDFYISQFRILTGGSLLPETVDFTHCTGSITAMTNPLCQLLERVINLELARNTGANTSQSVPSLLKMIQEVNLTYTAGIETALDIMAAEPHISWSHNYQFGHDPTFTCVPVTNRPDSCRPFHAVSQQLQAVAQLFDSRAPKDVVDEIDTQVQWLTARESLTTNRANQFEDTLNLVVNRLANLSSMVTEAAIHDVSTPTLENATKPPTVPKQADVLDPLTLALIHAFFRIPDGTNGTIMPNASEALQPEPDSTLPGREKRSADTAQDSPAAPTLVPDSGVPFHEFAFVDNGGQVYSVRGLFTLNADSTTRNQKEIVTYVETNVGVLFLFALIWTLVIAILALAIWIFCGGQIASAKRAIKDKARSLDAMIWVKKAFHGRSRMDTGSHYCLGEYSSIKHARFQEGCMDLIVRYTICERKLFTNGGPGAKYDTRFTNLGYVDVSVGCIVPSENVNAQTLAMAFQAVSVKRVAPVHFDLEARLRQIYKPIPTAADEMANDYLLQTVFSMVKGAATGTKAITHEDFDQVAVPFVMYEDNYYSSGVSQFKTLKPVILYVCSSQFCEAQILFGTGTDVQNAATTIRNTIMDLTPKGHPENCVCEVCANNRKISQMTHLVTGEINSFNTSVNTADVGKAESSAASGGPLIPPKSFLPAEGLSLSAYEKGLQKIVAGGVQALAETKKAPPNPFANSSV